MLWSLIWRRETIPPDDDHVDKMLTRGEQELLPSQGDCSSLFVADVAVDDEDGRLISQERNRKRRRPGRRTTRNDFSERKL